MNLVIGTEQTLFQGTNSLTFVPLRDVRVKAKIVDVVSLTFHNVLLCHAAVSLLAKRSSCHGSHVSGLRFKASLLSTGRKDDGATNILQ